MPITQRFLNVGDGSGAQPLVSVSVPADQSVDIKNQSGSTLNVLQNGTNGTATAVTVGSTLTVTNSCWLQSQGFTAVLLTRTGALFQDVTFAPTGLPGATAASRYVGATASGAPVSGAFLAGDFVVDQAGTVWVCTAAGSPGTWLSPQQGIELGYAQITSSSSTISSLTPVAVTGLTTTVTVGSRPIFVEACGLGQAVTTNITDASFYIFEDGVQVAQSEAIVPSAQQFQSQTFIVKARRSPSAGSHTYALFAAVGNASNTTLVAAAANGPAFIRVTQG